jgi:hypothetical protein
MRRLGLAVAALLLIVAAFYAAYRVGYTRGADSTESAVCREAVDRKNELLDEGRTLAKGNTETVSTDERRRTQAAIRPVIQEVAILVEQNPSCFSPTDRAGIEALNRGWNPAGR